MSEVFKSPVRQCPTELSDTASIAILQFISALRWAARYPGVTMVNTPNNGYYRRKSRSCQINCAGAVLLRRQRLTAKKYDIRHINGKFSRKIIAFDCLSKGDVAGFCDWWGIPIVNYKITKLPAKRLTLRNVGDFCCELHHFSRFLAHRHL